MKKKIKKRIPAVDATRVEAPLVGRRAALARHAEKAAPKVAAVAAGLRGRAAFLAAQRGGGK